MVISSSAKSLLLNGCEGYVAAAAGVFRGEPNGCSMRLMSMGPGCAFSLGILLLATGCTGSSASTATGPSPTPSARPFSGATPLLPPGPEAVIPGRQSTLSIADKQSVVLTHCGILHIRYQGQEWEVLRPPFNGGGTVPDTFTGFGSFAREGEALMYTDERGATLRFTVEDGKPDPHICA